MARNATPTAREIMPTIRRWAAWGSTLSAHTTAMHTSKPPIVRFRDEPTNVRDLHRQNRRFPSHKVNEIMRKLVSGLAAAAFLALGPVAVSGQVQLGPTLAIHEHFDFGIGATLVVPPQSLGAGVGFMGDFVFYFPDAGDYFEINGNITYDFPLENSTVVPFVLGGLNIGRYSLEVSGVDASNTEVGINLGGGIVFDAGNFRPSVAAKIDIGAYEGFVVFATLPFQVGN